MIDIRKGTINDAALLSALAATTFRESHGHAGPAADINAFIAEKYSQAAVAAELENEQNIFYIIYLDGTAAGYAKMIFDHAYPAIENKHVTKLERFYLLQEFLDKKLGKALFEFITGLSSRAGQAGIWLYVWIENERALRFYRRAGFEVIDHVDYKISATHANPNYIMYKEYKMQAA